MSRRFCIISNRQPNQFDYLNVLTRFGGVVRTYPEDAFGGVLVDKRVGEYVKAETFSEVCQLLAKGDNKPVAVPVEIAQTMFPKSEFDEC